MFKRFIYWYTFIDVSGVYSERIFPEVFSICVSNHGNTVIVDQGTRSPNKTIIG